MWRAFEDWLLWRSFFFDAMRFFGFSRTVEENCDVAKRSAMLALFRCEVEDELSLEEGSGGGLFAFFFPMMFIDQTKK
jgi:hypothetical protein